MPEQSTHALSWMNEYEYLEPCDPAERPAVCPLPGNPDTVVDMTANAAKHRFSVSQLQHIRKMDAISTIASGIAHNFRNTLNEISINSQVLQMTYKDASELQEITGRINASVKRAVRLVDGLLQFSRKQANAALQMLDLTGVLKEIYELIRDSFDHKIDIRIEFPPSLPVMGDHSGLSQALINLCHNARDAMPNGGVLSIAAGQVTDATVVVVSDNGMGMDRETIEKCFDPFFTTKPVGEGVGLGLSATYGIIKRHNGLITVDSEPGKGTRVQIQLPMAWENTRIDTTPKPKFVRDKGAHLEAVDKKFAMVNTCKACLAK